MSKKIEIEDEIEQLKQSLIAKEQEKQKKLEEALKAEPLTEGARVHLEKKLTIEAVKLTIDNLVKKGKLSIELSPDNLKKFLKDVLPKLPESVSYEGRHYFKTLLKQPKR